MHFSATGSRSGGRNVAHASEIIEGPPVRCIMVALGHQLFGASLAEHFEPGLQVFDQVIANTATGKATISKGGASKSYEYTDATEKDPLFD